MARRKRRKSSTQKTPLPMILGAVVALAVIFFGYKILTSRSESTTHPELPAKIFQDNPDSLRGSDFSVIGQIKEKLHHSDQLGTLISIEVEDDGETYMLPIRVPAEIDGPNLSVEQKYIFNGTINTKKRFVVSSYDDK